jgi:Putative zinc-finger
MKCDACLPLLEEYIDTELVERDAAQVSAHLITCASCANEFDTLSAEQEIYSRYDRSINVSPQLWHSVEAAIAPEQRVVISNPPTSLRDWIAGWFAVPAFGVSFAGAMVILIGAAVIGIAYLKTHRQAPKQALAINSNQPAPKDTPGGKAIEKDSTLKSDETAASNPNHGPVKDRLKVAAGSGVRATKKLELGNQSDVLLSDVADLDIEDQDTQRHIEQAQNLLRSVRNLQVSDGTDDVDVSYEKALSRRLLNENIVLRRDAEMSGKFPIKTLLSSLEPFLIDIANLPDRTSADDLRVIKDRVQKTEIVAALYTF